MKYAKPAGVIASLIPMTNPAMTPPVTGVYSAKTRTAVILSPHPRTAGTTWEMVEVMRAACRAVGAPEDLFQTVRHPSIPLTQHLMEVCDILRIPPIIFRGHWVSSQRHCQEWSCNSIQGDRPGQTWLSMARSAGLLLKLALNDIVPTWIARRGSYSGAHFSQFVWLFLG